MPLLLVAGWNDGGERSRGTQAYIALTLTIESMVLISVVSLDVLLFYVFFEAMLIPMYFLIGGFGGGAHRSRAAVKFLLYNLFGGLIMLAAVIGLYVVTAEHGPGTFDFRQIVAAVSSGSLGASSAVLKALFLGFMFAFAIKAPLWPFHRWLPDAAVESTPATAVLITAVMDKVGTFGMLRYCLQLFPDASTYFRPAIVVLAVIGVIYGAIVAIGQTDIMRLIAYTSISHFGFIILGIFVMTTQGQSGSTLYMLNHGISTAAVFLIAGFLISRRGTRSIAAYGGVQKVAPVLAGTFLIAGLATRVAARAGAVRQRIPGADRRIQPLLAGGGVRGDRAGALVDLHSVAVPTGDDRPRRRGQRTDPRPGAARNPRRRTADRVAAGARGLPEAGARHHQPRGGEHHGHHRSA